MKLFFLSIVFLCSSAYANNSCTDWTQTRGVSCVFAGDWGNLWQRQCLNPCHNRNSSYQCDKESICVDSHTNPNQLSSSCTDWTKDSGVSCLNVNTGNWEQRWIRACQTETATQWCSEDKPPFN